MGWWSDNNMRLVQNNTTDVNAGMDVDRWIKDLQAFECTVAMAGVGGITSFFPTKLAYQRVSPFLPEGRDLVREMIDQCHAAGIRFIGRFDFGRAHESFYDQHPEWFFRAADGRLLRCADTLTTCISGWYQQEYSKEIVREAMERYPDMDGIFFNAFGFSGWDYHGNQYGICHCEACKRRFREFSGMELPENDAPNDPALPQYQAFQRKIIADALTGIQRLIRSINPEVCLCTYTPDGVDVIRNESNSGVGRPLPFALMRSSFNIAAARHTWPNQPMANCVINATDTRWRYAGVSPNLTQIRLYENIAAGGCLDFCINGVFDDYPDQASLEPAREVFRYHKRNERYYGHLVSQAKALLLRAGASRPIHDGSLELFGVMNALKEEHIPFDLQLDDNIAENPSLLARYDAVIVPDVKTVGAAALQAVRQAGKKLIACAVNAPLDAQTEAALGLKIIRVEKDNAGAYLETRQKNVFRHFAQKRWAFVTGDVGFAEAPGYEALLPYVEKGEFGPAERAYGYRETELGTVWTTDDRSVTVFTWQPGLLYYCHGYQDHKYLLTDVLDFVCPTARVLRTEAHPHVELFWDASGDAMLLQAVNLSGFNGITVEEPVRMQDVRVTVPFHAKEAHSLDGSPVEWRSDGNETEITFKRLERFAAVALK